MSEAGASTVSSYRAGAAARCARSPPRCPSARAPRAGSPSRRTGRFAYTGNASGSISGFAIGRDGSLTALGTTTTLVPSPRDLDFDASGRFLHAVGQPAAARSRRYRVGRDGSLTLAGTAPAAAGITGAARVL